MANPGTPEGIRVASGSSARRVAGAIAHAWRAGQRPVTMYAIGARAVNQAVKAIAIASRYLGIHLACVPELKMTRVNGQERIAVTLVVLALDEKGVP